MVGVALDNDYYLSGSQVSWNMYIIGLIKVKTFTKCTLRVHFCSCKYYKICFSCDYICVS